MKKNLHILLDYYDIFSWELDSRLLMFRRRNYSQPWIDGDGIIADIEAAFGIDMRVLTEDNGHFDMQSSERLDILFHALEVMKNEI